MLSPIAISRPSASPSACLRCQLREALLQLHSQRQTLATPRCRVFSTTRSRQDEHDEAVTPHSRRPYEWKHPPLQEWIVGRPGRRQRVVSQRLVRDSLKEPSNIIVFSDVKEVPNTPLYPSAEGAAGQKPSVRQALSAEDVRSIEDAVLGRELVPEEAEVNASIDALRPDNTVMDKAELEQFRKTLSQGYTFEQLSTYLAMSLQTEDVVASLTRDESLAQISASPWRPGSSPLNKRHGSAVKNATANTKPKVIDRILRSAWQLTTEAEDQATGELELRLTPWQMSLLFDITYDGKPYYEHLISSQLLLQSSRVEAWFQHDVLRITARRKIAQELATHLTRILINVEPLKLDLEPYLSIPGVHAHLKNRESQLFRDEDLHFVSDATKCVIVQESVKVVSIFGATPPQSFSARRLLLSLLGIPPPRSDKDFLDVAHYGDHRGLERLNAVADPDSAALHRRHRGLSLHRVTASRKAKSENESLQGAAAEVARNQAIKQLSKSIHEKIHCMPSLDQLNEDANRDGTSYWRAQSRTSDWKADFCELLRPTTSSLSENSASKRSNMRLVVHAKVPGAEALLNYFEPQHLPRPLNSNRPGQLQKAKSAEGSGVIYDRRMPYLVSHFLPSGAALAKFPSLPRIELRFRFSAPTASSPRQLQLVGLKAILGEQHLKVPLPHYPADLRFSREASVVSNISAAAEDGAIQDFWMKLQESVQSERGALTAPPSLLFKIPQWMSRTSQIDTTGSQQKTEDVEYLFERFQQVQTVHFTPSVDESILRELNPDARSVLNAFPNEFQLAYQESEGGAIHGSTTSLSLRRKPPPSLRPGSPEHSSRLESVSTVQQVETSGIPHSINEEHGGLPDSADTASAVQEESPSSKISQLTAAALQVAELLARANAGTLCETTTDK